MLTWFVYSIFCYFKSNVLFIRVQFYMKNYNYYYLTPLEFFPSVLADGFSLEFEWQQVSSSLQDSSPDSGRS